MDLTEETVARLESPGRYRDAGRGAVPGLYFQVSRAGGRSWVFRYKWGGRDRMLGLGRLSPAVNLTEARRRAKKALGEVYSGTDPIAVKKEKSQKRTTFRQAAEAFIKTHERGWKNEKHRDQWRSTLEMYAYPKIGHLAIMDINTTHVLSILRPIWNDKTETAKRLRGRLEQVLESGDHSDNPARWTKLKHKLAAPGKIAKAKHHPALPFEQVADFMRQLATHNGISPLAFQFLILTAARTSEVTEARWSEIDEKNRIWTVPAERMKAGREHRVPLSDQAIKLLKALPREDDFIFIGPRKGGLSNMAFLTLLKRMGRADITTHGFRSSFRDWCAERTNYPREVAEMALAHSIRDDVEAAYRRGDLLDKRRRLMGEWAAYCFAPPVKSAKVLSIQGAAR